MKVSRWGSMCNMMMNSKYDNDNDTKDFNANNFSNDGGIKTSQVRSMCEFLGRYYKKVNKKETAGFNYYEYRQTNKYVCFLSRNLLMRVSEEKFRIYGLKYIEHPQLHVKFVEKDGNRIMIVNERKCDFRPQVGFIQKCIDTFRSPFVMLENAKHLVNTMTSKASKMLLIDVIAMLLNLREGYFTATKLVSVLMQLYTIHSRYMDLFTTQRFERQSGATVTDLLMGFSLMGLPLEVINAIKTFTTLTGKRVFESDLFLDMAEKVFECLLVMVKWIAEPFEGVRIFTVETEDMLVSMLNKLGTSVFMHKDIKTVCDIYTKYVSNPQILFDPTFRQEIMNKYNQLKANANFMAYVQNGNNKYFMTTWTLFEANVVKSCQAFDTSGRDEPVCFVFEGEAGSGKSCVMNSFVALLKESGMTTICHSVPAAEDGKDFYDDYENQDVFVMDDVGQQGKSQWRYLINYVSPVKYPLPCATASKKNTKFFNSKIILCTTNHFRDLNGFTSSDCISEPEALYRRAHVISINRGQSDHFSQDLAYYKFDHIGSKQWENKFINHTAVNVPQGLETRFSTAQVANPDNSKRVLWWLYSVFIHVLKAEKANNAQMSISEADYKDIIQSVNRGEVITNTNATLAANSEEFEDAVDNNWEQQNGMNFEYVKYVLRAMMPTTYLRGRSITERVSEVSGRCSELFGVVEDQYIMYFNVCREFVSYYVNTVYDYMRDVLPTIVGFITNLVGNITVSNVIGTWFNNGVFIGCLLAYMIGTYVIGCFFGEEEIQEMPTPEFNSTNVKNFVKDDKRKFFGPQSDRLRCEHDELIKSVKKLCKTLVIKHDKDVLLDEHTQCVVSGKRLLLPAHVDVGNRFVDIYQTWEHYKEKHVEIENVQLRLIRKYVLCDLAVYEIKNVVPLYKLNRHFCVQGKTDARNWYLINSTGSLPVVYDVDVCKNDEPVKYSTVYGDYNHDIDSGFYTPFSASGACGTVLLAPGAGIVGFHVAGSTTMGFCVQPKPEVMSEIRDLMLNTAHATNFDLDERIISNFSGVRVRYEEPVDQIRTLGETSFQISPLHVDVCEPMRELIANIEQESEAYTPTPVDKIDVKSPPNFSSKGTPAQTLKQLSKKTFMRQGRISNDEMEFMKSYLRTIAVPFTDLDDDEVAFGGTYVPPLNKDSSNGYGCLKHKEEYFDFTNKVIKPEAYALISRVSDNARNECYDYNDFMCRETFKDELRKSTKVDEPRTFRVMPLGHIWWTKKIFGQLLKHFKDNRMQTGISVGYNPYKDADLLAKKLLMCEITGDADFGKWDGTILAALIHMILEVLGEFYQGENGYMIPYLATTIANSFVLVNDEIYATTHGLPSGTWLTLVLNCLLNKCLTALVIYRFKPDPHVQDVHSVVDFVTGDDKVFGADAEMAPYFNLLNIKAVSESLGMDCTNGDKTKITRNSQEFHKLTYVKRHFRMHPQLQRYVGCLSMDTILNTLQWVSTQTSDMHVAMLGKMRSMQVEAYLHSRSLFFELTRIFNKQYPFEAFFDEQKVLRILNDDEGYDSMLVMQNKNFNH